MAISRPEHYSLSFDEGWQIGDIYYGGGLFEKPIDFPAGISYWDFGTTAGTVIPADAGTWFISPNAVYDLYDSGASGAGVMYRNEYNYDVTWYFESWGKNQIGDSMWDFLIDYCNDNFYWLWGNVLSGLAVYREPGTSNRFGFFASYGLWKNETTGDMRIACSTQPMTYSVDQMKEGSFAWYTGVPTKTNGEYNGTTSSGVWWICRNFDEVDTIRTYTYAMTDYTRGWILYGYEPDQTVSDTMKSGFSSTALGGSFPTKVFSLNCINSPYHGIGACYTYHDYTGEGYDLIAGGAFVGASDTSADASHTPADSGGGKGDYDTNSDPIPSADASQFTTDALNSGFLTVFNPTKAEIISFAEFLYSNSITDAIANQLKHLIADPLDYIVGLNMAHFTPVVSGSGTINFGGVSSGVTAGIVSPQMQFLDCGTVGVPEQTNSFQDYEMSSVSIYIPYCGIHELNIKEVMGGSVQVKYVIDCLTGSCIADVIINKSAQHAGESNLNSVLYSFTGNCFQSVPLTARDFSSTISGLLGVASSVGTMVGGVATGNPVAMAMGASGAINGAMQATPNVSRIGNYSSNYGYMQYQKPYLILKRPIASLPDTYEDFYGRPLYQQIKVDKCEGYIEIDTDTLWTGNFDDITAEEEQMLKDICNKGGIYLDHTSAYYDYEPSV